MKYLIYSAVLLMFFACTPKQKQRNLMQPEYFAKIERSENGDYLIRVKDSLNCKISNGKSEATVNWNEPIPQSTNLITFPCANPQNRLVFGLINLSTKDTIYLSEKRINMQGSPNFRDLGGIVTSQGKQLQWGKIFRSGNLSALTKEDLERFLALNINRVIDFRTEAEISAAPDLYPNENVKYVVSTIGNPADVNKISEYFASDTITAEKIKSLMMNLYVGFNDSLKHFQPVFDALLTNNDPFLFHCTAGKDRTGISAALILMALGVDREIIMNDYLLTNQYVKQADIEKMKAYGLSEEAAMYIIGVQKEYLQSFFNAIDSKYKSTDEMLNDVFGITAEQRQYIINKYTL